MELRRVEPDDPAQKKEPTVHAVDIKIDHEEALELLTKEIEDPGLPIEQWLNQKLRKEVPGYDPLWFQVEAEHIPGGIRLTTWSAE